MVEFQNDYWIPLDRNKNMRDKLDISIKDIGISHGMGDPLKGLRTHIAEGASHVELGFGGIGKGSLSGGNVTPETVSKESRKAIKELSRINKVGVSTHASYGVTGFAGFTPQGFSDSEQQKNLNEIKKAIEFAADATEGGAVVIHPGEFPRPISEFEGFEEYEGEKQKGIVNFVDDRTGKILQLTQDIAVHKPVMENGEYVIDKSGGYKLEKWGYKDYLNKFGGEKTKAAEAFYKDYLRNEFEKSEAISNRRRLQANDIKKEIDEVDALIKTATEDKKLKYKSLLEELKNKREAFIEESLAHAKDAAEKKETFDHIKPIKDYGLKRSASAISDAAIYAYELEKKRDLKKPLFISPENIFPEFGYSSHPKELKELIQQSRKELARKLMQKKGLSKEGAKEEAEKHIRATFDIGHVNVWKRFFKGSDEDFKKWVNKEVDDLVKNKIIGHVHMSDNFGYNDEHLKIGEGNAPIEDFVKKMVKAGITKEGPLIAEGGGTDPYHEALTGAWEKLNAASLYRTGSPSKTWEDIEIEGKGHGYTTRHIPEEFGTNKERFKPWSTVPLE